MERNLPRARWQELLGGALASLCLVVAGGCGPSASEEDSAGNSTHSEDPSPEYDAVVQVLDESGNALPSATYTLEEAAAGENESSLETAGAQVDSQGRFRLAKATGPVLVTLAAPGFLPEPLVVDRTLAAGDISVRLLRESGDGGSRRIVLHFGGDTMLGRRYVTPTSETSARVTPGDGGSSARAVARAIAPLFRAAHLRSVNLETVVGSLPQASAFPKKRFLLQSPPETVQLLDELGVNVCTLGNNHARDWLDTGVQSTVDALDAAGIPHVGGGVTAEAAATPVVLDLAGYRLGFLSYTSVNGDFVNDSLPLNSTPRPSPLAASEAWQYELRSFSFSGAQISVPAAMRRVGEFWQTFTTIEEAGGDEVELNDLWESAVSVYPELQDWVARRGHGGANPYDSSQISSDVSALRAGGCELVIVQFHSGFQFFEVKSEHLEGAAHRAIDVGADIVVCHHPHVLQGFEWYHGNLIAYSLGNFVFDQDFLTTFDSTVLRVVFEETSLLEARALPVVLERYVPRPLGGRAAANVIQMLHERSVLPFRSERIAGGVRRVRRNLSSGATLASLQLERNTGLIVQGAARAESSLLTASAAGIIDLPVPRLTRSRGPGGALLAGAFLGRDLFRWGDFEDEMADGESRGGPHWLASESFKRIEALEDAPSGRYCLKLKRSSSNGQRAFVRPVARIPMVPHRLHAVVNGTLSALDASATYGLRFQARAKGTQRLVVRFDVYHFDDSNPTEDPESNLLRSEELVISVTPDNEWHETSVDVPARVFRPAGALDANAMLLNLGLEPPAKGEAILRLDDVQFIEWRSAAGVPDGFYAVDALRVAAGATVEVERTEE